MAINKNKKTGKWYFSIRITTLEGEKKQKKVEGFRTKKEAEKACAEFQNKYNNQPTILFKNLVKQYLEDMNLEVKLSTKESAENIIYKHILPFFGEMPLADISKDTVKQWQNQMKRKVKPNGQPYSPVTLRKIHMRLSAIFNFAIENCHLQRNPAREAHSIGKKEKDDFIFWELKDYKLFRNEVAEEPDLYYAFEVLYWTGIREGELLALTREDFDLKRKELKINKTFYHVAGQNTITTTKTKKGNRIIPLPEALCEEMEEYFNLLYNLKPEDRVFLISKTKLQNGMKKYSEKAGVKKIRIHDLRHSHISLLINKGFDAVTIGARVGHSSQHITLQYAHIFSATEKLVADKLNELMEG